MLTTFQRSIWSRRCLPTLIFLDSERGRSEGSSGEYGWFYSINLGTHAAVLIFRSVYVECPSEDADDEDFIHASWRVRCVAALDRISVR